MKTIHWGIIGCGNAAEVKSGPAVQKIEHASQVAVIRRNAARHGMPRWHIHAEDWGEDPRPSTGDSAIWTSWVMDAILAS